jgi:hypothetical protein
MDYLVDIFRYFIQRLAGKATEYLFWMIFDYYQKNFLIVDYSVEWMVRKMLNKIDWQLLFLMG